MKKVLICDDNLIELENIKRLLDKKIQDIEVFCFDNAQDAMQFLRGNTLDLVITDVRMPLMSGLELSEQIKILAKGLPVIIISAFSEFEYAQKAVELGVVNYLTKPLDIVKFENVVRDILFSGEPDASLTEITKEILTGCDGVSPEKFSKHTKRTLQMIQDDYGDCNFGLAAICRRLYISQSQLCAVFKKDTGYSVLKFIIMYRMLYAKRLLETTELSLKAVMGNVGISSMSYFCSSFKKLFEVNPSDIRRENAAQ